MSLIERPPKAVRWAIHCMSASAVDVPALLAQHVSVEEENRVQPSPRVRPGCVSIARIERAPPLPPKVMG
jgi:hypothetical protein